MELNQRVSSSGQDPDMVKVIIDFYGSYKASIREDFSDWIADLLNRWNQRNTQQIVNHASKRGIDIFDDEQAVKSVLDRVPNPLNNTQWFINTLIPAIPEEFDDLLFEMVEQLSEDNGHEQNLMAAQIFSEYPDRLEEVQGAIIECCQRQISSANTNKTKTYLQAEVAAYNRLEDSDKEGFIKQLDSLLSGDKDDHQAFEDIWNQIEGEIEPERRTSVARNLRSQLRTELTGSPQHNRLFPLVNAFNSLVQTEDVDEDDGEWVVERLSDAFEGRNLHNNHVSTLIDKLAELSEYYGREELILTRLESLIESNNNNKIQQSAKKLISILEKTGEVDEHQIEDVREQLNI